MRKEPTQHIYDAMFVISQESGFNTYEFLPREDVPYPFVSLGQAEIMPRGTKSKWLGQVLLFIDVYGDTYSRKEVSDMCNTLLSKSRFIEGVELSPSESHFTIIQDQSTAADLWHGRITLLFNF